MELPPTSTASSAVGLQTSSFSQVLVSSKMSTGGWSPWPRIQISSLRQPAGKMSGGSRASSGVVAASASAERWLLGLSKLSALSKASELSKLSSLGLEVDVHDGLSRDGTGCACLNGGDSP